MVMAKLAKWCLNLKGKKRPTMREVWMQLERISSSQTMENDVDEEGAQLSIDVTASSSTSQYNVDAALWSDVEPMLPRQTW
ncbi:Wall-associated receptor kinase-like 4 [Cardamine amara subsp. amara]|uniref:Wall-associated receptor kinase-like 4 n=1 Tax=Cardamine amara subsp. amara TaxID=228776 RepID=A0ABD1B1Z9_CARAN